jgi:hypothetical protein
MATPSPITYGTALSATQLDATASVSGNFAYTPAAGTVPLAGTQTLSVTFTPTDSMNYTSVTATVPLTVNSLPVSVTVTPPSATLYSGQTQQFNASVSNTSNTSDLYTADGERDRNQYCGLHQVSISHGNSLFGTMRIERIQLPARNHDRPHESSEYRPI